MSRPGFSQTIRPVRVYKLLSYGELALNKKKSKIFWLNHLNEYIISVSCIFFRRWEHDFETELYILSWGVSQGHYGSYSKI